MNAKKLNFLSDSESPAGIFTDYAAKFGINQLINKALFAEAAQISEEDFIKHLCELMKN